MPTGALQGEMNPRDLLWGSAASQYVAWAALSSPDTNSLAKCLFQQHESFPSSTPHFQQAVSVLWPAGAIPVWSLGSKPKVPQKMTNPCHVFHPQTLPSRSPGSGPVPGGGSPPPDAFPQLTQPCPSGLGWHLGAPKAAAVFPRRAPAACSDP